MGKFGKWFLVLIVTLAVLWFTYGPLVSVFQVFSEFLIGTLSFPDWLGNFLGGSLHMSLYVLGVWWLAGWLGLLDRPDDFIAEKGWWLFLLVWLGISMTIVVTLLILVAVGIIYLINEESKDDYYSQSSAGAAGYDTSAVDEQIRQRNAKNQDIEDWKRKERGLIKDQEIARRMGNTAEDRRIQDQRNAGNRQFR